MEGDSGLAESPRTPAAEMLSSSVLLDLELLKVSASAFASSAFAYTGTTAAEEEEEEEGGLGECSGSVS